MKEYNLEGFERGLFELGIKLSDKQKTQFLQYYELLVEWNSFMNLTAITEFDQGDYEAFSRQSVAGEGL